MRDADDLFSRIRIGRSTKNYLTNQEVFIQGELADLVFFIIEGRIKLTVLSEHGKDAVIGIVEEGQFFGEGCLQDLPVRRATAVTLGPCRITSITRAAMLSAIRDEPELSKLFLSYLLSRNSRIQADVIDQLFNSVEKRLARLLLILANYDKEGSPPITPIALSQETLAEMIGTTRSRVSFFMNKFRNLGLIDYNGEIHVQQSLLNTVLRDQTQ